MSESDQSGAGRREVAYRLFATEFEDADLSYSESDEERAPNYVITPTGARINRLFVVGVLTEVEQVSDDVLRGRVVDPTGAFVLYAGQYQPDEMAFLESASPPTFVAVTGKARTFQPDDSDRVFTSIRPESINEVDADTRDRWTVQAAEQTLDRISRMADALALDQRGDELRAALTERGVDAGLAAGIPIALDHYGTTPTYLDALREVAVEAARVVAETQEEVSESNVGPADEGETTLAALSGAGVNAEEPLAATTETAAETGSSAVEGSAEQSSEVESSGMESPDVESETGGGTQAAETPETGAASTADESTAEPADDAGDLGDFDSGEYELEEETREQIEEEYGTEFQTGTEVEEPGSADIESPPTEGEEAAQETGQSSAEAGGGAQVDELIEEAEDGNTAGSSGETAAESGTQTAQEPGAAETTGESEQAESGEAAAGVEAAEEPEEDATGEETQEIEPAEEPDDLQAAVVDLMEEMDDGDGVEREALIEGMDTRYGTDAETVEEAIQGALMDGQCYEPDETTLKPI